MFRVVDSRVLADRDTVQVYVVNGVTYVPHYLNDQFFVGPGYPRHHTKCWSSEELIRAGARQQGLMLWPRAKHGQKIKVAA